MIKTVNEDRLFSLLPYFFDNPSSVVIEIAQNAQRSGATRLDITLENGILRTFDNGSGTDNPEPLFVLADSSWSEEVEENQKPAGWGLFFLYSIAESVIFASKFGTVEVDCHKYLSDGSYRANILSNIDSGRGFSGFSIEAILRAEVRDNILDSIDRLSWFPLDVTVNGLPVAQKNAEDEFGNYDICTVYEGNRVYIKTSNFPDSSQRLLDKLMTIWYGIPVNTRWWTNPAVVIDVKEGTPLTPVLPYRQTIKQDEKFDAFWKFIRNVVVEHTTRCINGAEIKDESRLKAHMENMERLGTQEELDRLERFYFVKFEPHHDGENVFTRSIRIIGKEDIPPVDEELVLEGLEDFFKKESFDHDHEDVFLPEGTIKSVNLPERRPGWLKTRTVKRTIRISAEPGSLYSGRFNWVKASIEADCSAPVKLIAVISDSYSGYIFYSDTPADVYDVIDPVFDNRVYSDEGDQWDSQRCYFEEELQNDIMSITGAYRLHKLLDGLLVAGITPEGVLSIEVNRAGKTMIVRTEKGAREVRIE